MADNDYKKISNNGLWHNNPALIQLLGLCPLLAVSSTFINALGLGIATTLVMIGSNVTVSLVRDQIKQELRIPVFVLIIASFVTVVELMMNAYLHELYKILGIFIPLIVTNCVIIARAEAFAAKNDVKASFVDGLTMGLGFTAVLLVLGGMREVIGQGTLFSQAHLMFGEGFRELQLVLIDDYSGFLLAVLPPGAFIGLGFLIALKNVIEGRRVKKLAMASAANATANVTETAIDSGR
ncbi:MAG: electron transport complex subunit E [Gammaproteobacteria bacterium]|nr:electron transport complex subunit E [Gammaproteobacteria bacterium]